MIREYFISIISEAMLKTVHHLTGPVIHPIERIEGQIGDFHFIIERVKKE